MVRRLNSGGSITRSGVPYQSRSINLATGVSNFTATATKRTSIAKEIMQRITLFAAEYGFIKAMQQECVSALARLLLWFSVDDVRIEPAPNIYVLIPVFATRYFKVYSSNELSFSRKS